MTMNDLTAPLGRGPKRDQRAIAVPVAKIVAIALGLFFGVFVLWAIIARDRVGGEPVAVAPADLHIAKKPPPVITVPQAAAAIDAAAPAAIAAAPPIAAPPPAPALKPPGGGVTVTIIDGKTGAKREVVVGAPADPASAETTGQLPSKKR